MSLPRQLPFVFDHRPSLSGEDFLVAPSNGEAVAWLDRWPCWPGPALVVYGPPGCGKSHLAQVFLGISGARTVTPLEMMENEPAQLLGDSPACLLEDAEKFLDQEEAFLHLYNTVKERNCRMMLTARRPPARWRVALADLRSRLNAATAVAVGAPEDTLIAAVLVKLFDDRQLRVDNGVVSYMLTRMERSLEAARRLVAAVDAAALAERRNITIPLVRKVLRRFEMETHGGPP